MLSNLSTNPNAVAASGFGNNNTTIWTVATNVAAPAGNPQGITTAASSVLQAGTVNPSILSLYNIDTLNNTSVARYVGAWFYTAAAGYNAQIGPYGSLTTVALPAGVWTWVTASVPANTYCGAFITKQAGNAGASDVGYLTGVTAITNGAPVATIAGGIAYPSTAAPDPDLTASWAGTANASATNLTGVGVAGLSASTVGVAAIRSSQWVAAGAYSLRLIPTSSTNNVSYTALAIPATAQAGGTAIVTSRQVGPITGSTWAQRGAPYVVNPFVSSPTPAPNAAGFTQHRITYGALTDSYAFVLPHGGLYGSGDVWYDLAFLGAGTYNGSAFTGDTPSNDLQSYQWSGPANASTSTYQTRASFPVSRSVPVPADVRVVVV